MTILQLKHRTIELDLSNAPAADPKLLDNGHPLRYVEKTKRATETYLNAFGDLLEGLPPGLNVLEFCGGIGLVAEATWDRFKPWSWDSVELDPACEPVWQSKRANLHLGSMYDPEWVDKWDANADNHWDKTLVIIDFPSNTIPKMWREPQRFNLLTHIASAKPRYWEITDVGYYWIHLKNHWPLYEGRFNRTPTRQNYHELFDTFMREEFGYKVIKNTVGGGAQYFLMEAV